MFLILELVLELEVLEVQPMIILVIASIDNITSSLLFICVPISYLFSYILIFKDFEKYENISIDPYLIIIGKMGKENKNIAALLIPAGLLIGSGLGFLFNNYVVWIILALGLEYLLLF
jgi:hypothetical protein